MNVYNYIDKNKTRELHYSYTEFNSIIENAGYKQEKNGFLHLFFDWSVIKHWSFEYELYNENQLTSYFKNTDPVVKNTNFIVRLSANEKLVEISALNIAFMLDDLNYETGMGWEAISTDGAYIMEFSDSFQRRAISNFQIIPS